MNELETLLKTHDWGTAGHATRPALDQAMRANAGAEATALWELHCPWSMTNGGYVAWQHKPGITHPHRVWT
jgi:hypothetical protein